MINAKDVTEQVEFELGDSEYVFITKCRCGHEFPTGIFVISIYKEGKSCPSCGAKLFFRQTVRIYQAEE